MLQKYIFFYISINVKNKLKNYISKLNRQEIIFEILKNESCKNYN